jgi:hypothetical protein
MRIAQMILVLLIVASAILATDATAEDEIYRWVDENGVVHFGDRPPANAEADQVSIQTSKISNTAPPSDSNSADPYASSASEPSVAQQLRDARAEKRAEAAEKEKIVAEACAQRRTIVSQLEPSTRVMVQLEDGTVARMDDDVRLETLNEANAYISANCKN